MRRLLRSKFLICFVIAVLVLGGFGIYGVFAGGDGYLSPIQNVIGMAAVPFEQAVTWVSEKTESVTDYIGGFDALQAENERLRRELAENEALVRSVRELEEENARLRELLKLETEHRDLDLVMAEVVASESGNWGKSYTLDCGEQDGVAVGNAVIVDAGMVGFVTRVGTNWCEMATIIDTDMRAGASVAECGEFGVCEGEFALMRDGFLKLGYLERDTAVKAGDSVETSGEGGVFPKGLYIGTVREILVEEHGITAYAVVEPAADMDKLGRVFVVKGFAA